MQDIIKRMEDFAPTTKNGSVFLTLPVVMHVSGSLLELCIAPHDSYYLISCTEDHFSEANGDQQRYFDIFMKRDPHYHYEMQILDNLIYKQYPNDFNVAVALNEFLRFFIAFDDFIMENGVIGNEEQFEDN